jgi:hypothetical protein
VLENQDIYKMTVSFVSKSIQTSTKDGDYEEIATAGAGESMNDDGAYDHRPLFDQLRANKEQDDEEREETQRNLMRGTLALDDEDAAHLDALHQEKLRLERIKQEETNKELAAFHAARMERVEETLEEDPRKLAQPTKLPTGKVAPGRVPLVIKRRRKEDVDNTSEASKKTEQHNQEKMAKTELAIKAGIGGLLVGYGSSSSDDE